MNTQQLYSLIENEIDGILSEVTDFRREIHRNPELRFEEEKTAGHIRNFLAGSGIEAESGIELNEPLLGTDVTGLIRGAARGGRKSGGPAPTVILRADMDALPLEDASGEDIRSRNPGLAHACGHDGHMAVLAGTLRVLSRLNGRLPGESSGELSGGLRGNVGFIFQPGEEEGMGARRLIDAGLFREGLLSVLADKAGNVDQHGGGPGDGVGGELRGPVITALHSWPGMPAGSFAARPGPYMAAADRFVLTVTGAGGHGAMPHLAADPVVAAAELILALQTIVSRKIDPTEPAVVTVGSIRGGTADNVIPDHVVLKGTIRSFSNTVQRTIREEIDLIAEGICRCSGCTRTIKYSDRYPVLNNDPAVVDAARETALEVFGTEGWFTGDAPSMGSEDFACYLEHMPGAMVRLGMGEDSPSLHAPDFEFREEALKPAIAFLSAFSINILHRRIPPIPRPR